MVGTGNPLFFYIFYRFTNGILLRTRRKTKIKSRQGHASRLASLLRTPPGSPAASPSSPRGSGQQTAAGERPGGAGHGGSGTSATSSSPGAPGPLLCLPGEAPASASPFAASRKGTRALGRGRFWRAGAATGRRRRALLHTSISSGRFAKGDLFPSLLAFCSFSQPGQEQRALWQMRRR